MLHGLEQAALEEGVTDHQNIRAVSSNVSSGELDADKLCDGK